MAFSGDFLRVNLSFQDHVYTKYVSLYFINLALLFDDIMTWMDLLISRVFVETIFECTIAYTLLTSQKMFLNNTVIGFPRIRYEYLNTWSTVAFS